MKTKQITKSDLDAYNYYAASDSLEFDGNIEVESLLGWVRFRGSVSATGSVVTKAGSGIEAGLGIKAGLGIEAGWGIKAGWGIEAGLGIEAGWGIKAGEGIEAGEGIKAKFVFSFQFKVQSKWIATLYLPFWRAFWAEMPPLKDFRDAIMDESKCWDALRSLVSEKKANEICAWDGWHPLLRAQLEMFFRLKDRVELPASKNEN